jgi:hypothetical protein
MKRPLRFLSRKAALSVCRSKSLDKSLDFGANGGVAVSPDDRRILYTQFDQAGSELMLVETFRRSP